MSNSTDDDFFNNFDSPPAKVAGSLRSRTAERGAMGGAARPAAAAAAAPHPPPARGPSAPPPPPRPSAATTASAPAKSYQQQQQHQHQQRSRPTRPPPAGSAATATASSSTAAPSYYSRQQPQQQSAASSSSTRPPPPSAFSSSSKGGAAPQPSYILQGPAYQQQPQQQPTTASSYYGAATPSGTADATTAAAAAASAASSSDWYAPSSASTTLPPQHQQHSYLNPQQHHQQSAQPQYGLPAPLHQPQQPAPVAASAAASAWSAPPPAASTVAAAPWEGSMDFFQGGGPTAAAAPQAHIFQPHLAAAPMQGGGSATGGDPGGYPFEDFDNEPPLLEELGINLEHIFLKTKAVVLPFRRFSGSHSALLDPDLIVQDADLAGPLALALLLAFELLCMGKIHFGYIYGFGMFGCLSLTVVLNLLSPVQAVSVWTVTSILGYSLLPVNLLAALQILFFFAPVVSKVLGGVVVLWSTLASTRLLEVGCGMAHQRYLIAYPIALVYSAFVLITIF